MKKTAVFPGSFDPVTKGHEDIIRRAIPLFDEVIVAIGVNSTKKYLFPLEQRTTWLQTLFAGEENVRVITYSSLTVDLCRENGAAYIIRGLRNSADFEFEKSIAQMNTALNPSIETVFLMTSPELAAINASIVREIYLNGGDISHFVPQGLRFTK